MFELGTFQHPLTGQFIYLADGETFVDEKIVAHRLHDEIAINVRHRFLADTYYQELGEEMSCCTVKIEQARKTTPCIKAFDLEPGKLFRRSVDSDQIVFLRCVDGAVKLDARSPCRPIAFDGCELKLNPYFHECKLIDGAYTFSVVERV
jgi:hypothetical protein